MFIRVHFIAEVFLIPFSAGREVRGPDGPMARMRFPMPPLCCCILVRHLALDFRFVMKKGLRESIPHDPFFVMGRRREPEMKFSSSKKE